jgi:hypothetical protein
VSSAILYLGIVAIWAFVLIPRWLRRPQLLGGETAEPEGITEDTDSGMDGDGSQPLSPGRLVGALLSGGQRAAGDSADLAEGDPAGRGQERPAAGQRWAPAPPARSKVLQVRRRLLTMLGTLTVVAAACTYLKLTSWWVCVPPAGMLGMYLLLLREAALADAEHARWRAAEDQRVLAARHREQVTEYEPTAQVIDILGRLGDQLYDQYADATMRAVGD